MEGQSGWDDAASRVLGDPARLAALRGTGLLDSLPEEPFDRLTRLASRVLHVPVALVSLVDEDRQFLKSCVGIPEPWASRREMPLSHPFCPYVVATAEPLVVDDAREHPQIRDNLAIPDLGVIAYAGVPLATQDGHVLGSFCAIDHQPRQWSEEDISLLRDLAASVMTEVALRADIIERQHAEEELERVSVRNKLILESAAEGIYGLDTNGFTTFANPAAAALLGYTMEELVGKSQHQIIHHTRPDGTPYPWEECPTRQTLQDGQVRHIADEVYWRKDGTGLPVEYTSTPQREGDRIVGAVVTFRDVSERREIERMKDEFISVVSHELRTPLTSIRGSLGLLASGLSGALPERGQRLLNIAVQNTDRLIRLINDILDIERIESGEVRMEKQVCQVPDLLTQTGEVLQPVADKAGVHLSVAPMPAEIWADPDRIIQVITNLLSNAIKFSPEGGTVSLTAQRKDSWIVFAVRDQGRGIPADRVESIFGRFQQVDASDSREKGGTGLGLAISRSIVQQHGGKIWVESTPGEGSTFYFTIPALGIEEAQVPLGAPLVLVCDDDPSILEVVGAQLRQQGYRVVTATSGADAIETAALQHPSAILLDLMMPGMDGWETMAALKANPATQSIPVIVLSGVQPAGGGAAGKPTVNWITKPFDESSLFGAIEQAIDSPSGAAQILLVEDDLDLARVIAATFQRHGIAIHHARTGTEAIELCEKINPNLVILDLVVPEGGGFAVVDWLRRHNSLRNVPLVVYSVSDTSPSERETLKLGKTEFLTKGRIAPEEFEERVLRLLDHVIPSSQRDNAS